MVNRDLDLARRAVACKHWRWLPGMLAIHPNWRGYRVSHVGLTGMHGACRYASPMGGVSYAGAALPLPLSSDVLPDLTDPATLGCLLALVRESCKVPDLYVAPVEYIGPGPAPAWRAWVVEGPDLHVHATSGKTEAAALVAALEAAP
jgi:hypothetical protein